MDKVSEPRAITSQSPATRHHTHTNPHIHTINTLHGFDHIHEYHECNFRIVDEKSGERVHCTRLNTPQFGAN